MYGSHHTYSRLSAINVKIYIPSDSKKTHDNRVRPSKNIGLVGHIIDLLRTVGIRKYYSYQ